jgi:hypothetical protein
LRSAFIFLIVSSALLVAAHPCYGSDFVFIRSSAISQQEQQNLQIAADFYGLDLRSVATSSSRDESAIREAANQPSTLAVAIDAEDLGGVNQAALFNALAHKDGTRIPLLILGVKPETSGALLEEWSGGAVTGCSEAHSTLASRFLFSRVDGVSGQLQNLTIPLYGSHAATLALGKRGSASPVESFWDGNGFAPVFVETAVGQQKVFLASAVDLNLRTGSQDVLSVFLQTAPEMMYTKYAAGDMGWHTPGYYANFTIDDPWLREPYGFVDYSALLGEMEKHNFHTTIAFIPWNYSRSQSEVVSLFRNHPERFSIAVHGDNHDHKEFTDLRSKPIAVQVRDLKQSLSRMEVFEQQTGIPYDKVMVFPHSIAPEQTLAALKKYNYWATVNSSIIPEGSSGSIPAEELLRPVTLDFGNFPSFLRLPAALPERQAYIAVSQFLGNPLFFYEHADYFADGVNAFDQVADTVNSTEPATKWRNLGEIVNHFYLLRRREDAKYDVRSFSGNICLENPGATTRTYLFEKPETGEDAIESATVDGKTYPYSLHDGQLGMSVDVAPGATSCIAINYANDLQSAPISPSHDSVMAYLLRMGSDFRDVYLAKSPVGIAAIHFYYDHELKPWEVVGCCIILIGAGAIILIFFKRRSRASRQSRQTLASESI